MDPAMQLTRVRYARRMAVVAHEVSWRCICIPEAVCMQE